MYRIQTGAFYNKERCQEFVFDLTKRGIKCCVEWHDPFWKSYIDRTYGTQEEAAEDLATLKNAFGRMFPPSFVAVNGKE